MVAMAHGIPLIVDSLQRDLGVVVEWGRQKMLDGAYDAAIQHFTAALDLKPGLMHALISRGFCHLTLGDEGRAQRDFAEVITKDAGFNRNVYVLIALCLKRSGEYQAAIRYLGRCIAQFAAFKPALVARGELSLKIRDYEKARVDFRQVLNDAPEHLVARRGLGDALRGMGNFREALRQYSRAVEDASQLLAQREREEAAALAAEAGQDDAREPDSTGSEDEEGSISQEDLGRLPPHGRPVAIEEEEEEGELGGLSRVESRSSKAASELARDRSSMGGSSSEVSRGRGAAGSRGPGRARASSEGAIVSSGEGGGGGSSSSSTVDSRTERRQQERRALPPPPPPPPGPESLACLQDHPAQGPEDFRAFLIDVLIRRSLLLRLMGELEAAGEDLLEVLQLDPCSGLALFWYGKLLIEQHRHKEAPAFLQASLEHHQDTRVQAHALLGALSMTWPDPDWELGMRNLKEAARCSPSSQPVRTTLWICSAAAALHRPQRDAQGALGLLDKALAALTQPASSGAATARAAKAKEPAPAAAQSGSHSARGPAPPWRAHVAGSGGAAACALTSHGKCPEEVRWSSTRALVRRREELAQGDDLELALECRTYLQLVAREPQQQLSEVPLLLYELRTMALCERGRWEDAVVDCRKALALNPADEETQYTLHIASGIVRARAAEFEAAVGHFTKAIRSRPVSAEARVHRAIALASAAWAAQGAGAERSPAAAGAGAGPGGQDAARAAQLLADATQDLEAVEQQAQIAGTAIPAGTWHLRAACLCSSGRPDEAWEVLRESRRHGGCYDAPGRGGGSQSSSSRTLPTWAGNLPAAVRQYALEAEALSRLGRDAEAVDACSALLAISSVGQVEAYLMRGCCRSHLGEVDAAFEDYHAARRLAPERRDVLEASGDLFLLHGHIGEAIAAFDAAAKPGGHVKPGDMMPARLAYKRAMAQLSQGNLPGAQKDVSCALRANMSMPAAVRARDGLAALQAILEGNYRHAHVRINMLIHASAPAPGGPAAAAAAAAAAADRDRLPLLFLPHEFLLYRGMCSLYLGETAAAIQDFGTSLELARRLAVAGPPPVAGAPSPATSCGSSPVRGGSVPTRDSLALVQADAASAPASPRPQPAAAQRPAPRRTPAELETPEGMEAFECELLYNVAICHLLAKDYGEALATCQQLLAKSSATGALGAAVPCLVWFLIGVCHLATGDSRDEQAREAFMRSYSHDPVYIDDFLRRHGRRQDLPLGGPTPTPPPGPRAAGAPPRGRIGGPAAAMRPLGGCPSRPSWAHVPAGKETCDAAPEAVCCLRRSSLMLSNSLPPCRLQVRDVVIWARPAVAWPFVRAPDLGVPAGLTRLDLLQPREPAAQTAAPALCQDA